MFDNDFVKNCPAERVAVGEWRGLPDTTSPPTGFIPNSYLDTTGNKTYSNRNSAKQVTSEKIEGQDLWLLLLKFELDFRQQQFPCLIQQLPRWYLLELFQQMLPQSLLQQPQSRPQPENRIGAMI